MKSFTYVIKDEVGIHARPAGLLVKEVKQYKPDVVVIKKGDKAAKASSAMGLMSLGVKCGEEVTVEVTGENEETTAAAVKAFMEANM